MTAPWTNFPVRMVLGVPLRAMRMDDVVGAADACLRERQRMLIGVVNAAKVVNMRKDAALRDAVLRSDLVLADGISVVWAGRMLGQRLPERVAGVDLMTRLLELADQRRLRVFLFGATEESLQAVCREIMRRYPGVVIAGQRNGYYAPDEEPHIAEAIRASSADVLFVAMSPPKKEVFLGTYADAMNVPVCHGVGGAFDVLAGKTRRAPMLWQRLGLEWLYRVVQEPRRMWKRYLVTNTQFCWLLLREWIRLRFGARPAVAEAPSGNAAAEPAPSKVARP